MCEPLHSVQWFEGTLLNNEQIAPELFRLRVAGCDALARALPGQFAMLRGAWGRDPVLPRAYSILSGSGGIGEFLVRRVGRGSGLIASASVGSPIFVLGPLGVGFPAHRDGIQDLLVAGGCGLPPLFMSAARAAQGGMRSQVRMLYGARTKHELVLLDELRERGLEVGVATEDGTLGHHGLVTELLAQALAEGRAPEETRVLSCGPTGMLRAVRDVARRHRVPCFVSVETEMACGLGACLGCAILAQAGGYLHACKDGPVFDAEAIWP